MNQLSKRLTGIAFPLLLLLTALPANAYNVDRLELLNFDGYNGTPSIDINGNDVIEACVPPGATIVAPWKYRDFRPGDGVRKFEFGASLSDLTTTNQVASDDAAVTYSTFPYTAASTLVDEIRITMPPVNAPALLLLDAWAKIYDDVLGTPTVTTASATIINTCSAPGEIEDAPGDEVLGFGSCDTVECRVLFLADAILACSKTAAVTILDHGISDGGNWALMYDPLSSRLGYFVQINDAPSGLPGTVWLSGAVAAAQDSSGEIEVISASDRGTTSGCQIMGNVDWDSNVVYQITAGYVGVETTAECSISFGVELGFPSNQATVEVTCSLAITTTYATRIDYGVEQSLVQPSMVPDAWVPGDCDVDEDGACTHADLARFAQCWPSPWSIACGEPGYSDFDEDGEFADSDDLQYFAQAWAAAIMDLPGS